MVEAKVIIGSNYGDEGKGQMADEFCRLALANHRETIVACTNGGPQRGHTVLLDNGVRHVFHHMGSGTLRGVPSYLPRPFLLNPLIFKQEWEELSSIGVTPTVFVNPQCMVTTPYDMLLNQAREEARKEARHGSCGMGIWETICRYRKTGEHLYAKDLFGSDPLCEKVLAVRDYALGELSSLEGEMAGKGYGEYYSLMESPGLLSHFLSDIRFMAAHTSWMGDEALLHYDTVIFENAQGLLLDEGLDCEGSRTTPSCTGLSGAMGILAGICGSHLPEVEACYVSRTYLTKHGPGYFPEECSPADLGDNISDATNVCNPHQGALRYAPLGHGALKERILHDASPFPSVRISIAFTHCNEVALTEEEMEGYRGWIMYTSGSPANRA